jgi:hypothetical protein
MARSPAGRPRRTKVAFVCIIINLLLKFADIAATYANASYDAQSAAIAFLQAKQAALVAIAGLGIKTPPTSRAQWQFNRFQLFASTYLIGSYTDAMFKNRVRVSKDLFQHLCETLGPRLMKQTTVMREPISVERRILASLYRLGHAGGSHEISDLFGMARNTVSPMLREFVDAVLTELQPIYVQWPETTAQLRQLADGFLVVQGIPNVVGAIDGSHIPIITPREWPADYYNRKGFHSILLQGVVDVDYKFWHYDIGRPGCMHDYKMFTLSDLHARMERGELKQHALLGDAAYQPRLNMLTPFMGTKEGLTPDKAYWNYIQSSSRMAVECAFGILKGRWGGIALLLNVELEFACKVVAACIVLHNMCRVHKESFERSWFEETARELAELRRRPGHNRSNREAAAATGEVTREMTSRLDALVAVQDAGARTPPTGQDEIQPGVERDEASAYHKGLMKRANLMRVLFDAKVRSEARCRGHVAPDLESSDSDSGEDM